MFFAVPVVVIVDLLRAVARARRVVEAVAYNDRVEPGRAPPPWRRWSYSRPGDLGKRRKNVGERTDAATR
jgi:hypothetical protein